VRAFCRRASLERERVAGLLWSPIQAAAWPTDDEAWLRSMHTQSFATVAARRLDPSLALGFYCRHAHDFADLRARLGQISADVGARGGSVPFTVEEVAPRDDASDDDDDDDAGSDGGVAEAVGHGGGGGGSAGAGVRRGSALGNSSTEWDEKCTEDDPEDEFVLL
jgi:hypothetical protein